MTDSKISELSAVTAVQATDILLMSQDAGAGSFVSKAITTHHARQPVVVPLSFSSTLATDASTGDIFTITLTGDMLIANPTSAVNGQAITWHLRQDGSGNHAITLGNKFNIPSSATSPLAFSTAASEMDMLVVRYDSGVDLFHVVAMVPGY